MNWYRVAGLGVIVSPWVVIVLVALALSGCAGRPKPQPEPRIVTVDVPKPVLVTCAAAEPQTKPYPDTAEALAAAPNIFELAKLIMAGRAIREGNEAILRAARKGCEGVDLGVTQGPR